MAYHSDSKGVKRRASPEPDTEVRRLRAKTEQVIINPFTFLEIYHLIRSQNNTDEEDQDQLEKYLMGRIGGMTHRPYLLFRMAKDLGAYPLLLRFFVEQRGFLVADESPDSCCRRTSFWCKTGCGSSQEQADTLLRESVRMWNEDPRLEHSRVEWVRPTFPLRWVVTLPDHGGIDAVMKAATEYAKEIESAVVEAGAEVLLEVLLRVVAAYCGPSVKKEDWVAGERPWLLQEEEDEEDAEDEEEEEAQLSDGDMDKLCAACNYISCPNGFLRCEAAPGYCHWAAKM